MVFPEHSRPPHGPRGGLAGRPDPRRPPPL